MYVSPGPFGPAGPRALWLGGVWSVGQLSEDGRGLGSVGHVVAVALESSSFTGFGKNGREFEAPSHAVESRSRSRLRPYGHKVRSRTAGRRQLRTNECRSSEEEKHPRPSTLYTRFSMEIAGAMDNRVVHRVSRLTKALSSGDRKHRSTGRTSGLIAANTVDTYHSGYVRYRSCP